MVFASLLLLAIQDPIAAPRLSQVVVDSAAVWVISEPEGGEGVSAYEYRKATGLWRRGPVGAVPAPLAPPSWRRSSQFGAPAVPLGSNFNLVYVVAGDTVTPAIVSRRDNQVQRLRPVMTAEDRHRLGPLLLRPPLSVAVSQLTIETAPVAAFSSAWTRHGNDVWFGLQGGFTEGGRGGLGGLIRFDLKTLREESVWARELLTVSVTSLAVVGDALWIGTRYPRELFPEEGAGLLRYDLRQRTWRRYVADSSPLPGNLVWAVAADGARLWVTTAEGVAMLDTRSGIWKVWSLDLALSGDTIVYQLAPGAHKVDAVRRGIFALLWGLRPTHPDAFVEACFAADTAPFAAFDRAWGWRNGGPFENAMAALAQPALVPFLVEALQRAGVPRQLGADALGRLGDPQWIPALRAVLDTNQSPASSSVAAALGLLGDSTGFYWVRDRLRAWHGGAAIGAAGRLRDRESIPLLVPVLTSSKDRWFYSDAAYRALAAIGTREAWIAVARGALCPNDRHTPCAKGTLFGDFLRSATGVPLQDSVFRAALGETAIASLLDPAPAIRVTVPRVVARLGRIDVWPQLVGMLTHTQDDYRVATETLIRLTAVDSGPTPPTADSTQRAAASAFWSQWFGAMSRGPAGLHAVSSDEGDAAFERWRARWRAP